MKWHSLQVCHSVYYKSHIIPNDTRGQQRCTFINNHCICAATLPVSNYALLTMCHTAATIMLPHCLCLITLYSSSSRMRVIYHNWSAMKQRPYPQSVAEISHHSVLSGGRIRRSIDNVQHCCHRYAATLPVSNYALLTMCRTAAIIMLPHCPSNYALLTTCRTAATIVIVTDRITTVTDVNDKMVHVHILTSSQTMAAP